MRTSASFTALPKCSSSERPFTPISPSPGRRRTAVIARIEIGRVGRLVLALQDARDTRREATERLVRRIDDEPLPDDLAFAEAVRLRAHRSPCSSAVPAWRRPRTTLRRLSPWAGAI